MEEQKATSVCVWGGGGSKQVGIRGLNKPQDLNEMALISVHKMSVLAPLNVETWLLLLPLSNGTLPTTTKKIPGVRQ